MNFDTFFFNRIVKVIIISLTNKFSVWVFDFNYVEKILNLIIIINN